MFGTNTSGRNFRVSPIGGPKQSLRLFIFYRENETWWWYTLVDANVKILYGDTYKVDQVRQSRSLAKRDVMCH